VGPCRAFLMAASSLASGKATVAVASSGTAPVKAAESDRANTDVVPAARKTSSVNITPTPYDAFTLALLIAPHLVTIALSRKPLALRAYQGERSCAGSVPTVYGR